MTKENQSLQLQERSNALIAIATNLESSREFERSLTVNKIIKEAVPMVELKRMVGSRQVAIALDVQLTRLVGSLNLKWNLNDGQIKTIVEDLIDKYPNESLEDFMLCFRKARQGEYGELIRLDSPIVFSWMSKYLDEKYQVLEAQLMKEREQHYKVIIPENSDRDWHKEWLEAVNKNEGMKRVPDLSDDEINDEGQAEPKKKVYRYDESEAEIRLREYRERLAIFQEKTIRERHPEFTEEQIQERCVELMATVVNEETKPKHSIPAVAKIWAGKKKKRSA